MKPHHPLVGNSFVNLCEDPSINKDVKFLDDLDVLLTNNDTGEIFMPNIKKLRAVYQDVRNSVKGRIGSVKAAATHDRNIFDLMDNL